MLETYPKPIGNRTGLANPYPSRPLLLGFFHCGHVAGAAYVVKNGRGQADPPRQRRRKRYLQDASDMEVTCGYVNEAPATQDMT